MANSWSNFGELMNGACFIDETCAIHYSPGNAASLGCRLNRHRSRAGLLFPSMRASLESKSSRRRLALWPQMPIRRGAFAAEESAPGAGDDGSREAGAIAASDFEFPDRTSRNCDAIRGRRSTVVGECDDRVFFLKFCNSFLRRGRLETTRRL